MSKRFRNVLKTTLYVSIYILTLQNHPKWIFSAGTYFQICIIWSNYPDSPDMEIRKKKKNRQVDAVYVQ